MRLAVCGTHGVGKSTLIAAFLERRKDYAFEPEAYEALAELHGEEFAADPSAEDYVRQLEYNIDRLREYSPGDRVIFERCPVDYVAYLLALEALARPTADAELAKRSIERAREAMGLLDIVLYLPARGDGPEAEDPELGRAVNSLLEGILLNGEFSFLQDDFPVVIEATGTITRRLQILGEALSHGFTA